MTESFAKQNAAIIAERAAGFTPELGLVLGSGSGRLADEFENPINIPYSDLKGFGDSNVKGHSGIMTLGMLHGMPTVCMQGRPHYYQGFDNSIMQTPMRTIKLLGCDKVVMTNASASLRPEVKPGSLVLVNDHINFSFHNPLVGPNDDEVGPRFPDMQNAYDKDLRAQMLACASQINVELTEGVYLGVLGPTYETPAEIRAFKMLGADVLGMSTVADVIVANHCGLKSAVIATITNMASGMSEEILTHDNVVKIADKAATDLIRLLACFLENMRAAA